MTSHFPPNTKIKDFGYPETHPFHIGNYLLKSNGSISSSPTSSTTSSSASSSSTTSSSAFISNKHVNHHHHPPHHHLPNNYMTNSSQFILSNDYNNTNNINDDDDDDNDNDNDDDIIDDDYDQDEINCKARAIFDFSAENDNEISLIEGQIIWISYRHGQGWLVAEDPILGENGLVPEEYVEIMQNLDNKNKKKHKNKSININGDYQEFGHQYGNASNNQDEDVPKRFLPEIFNDHIHQDDDDDDVDCDSEWVDTDYEEEEEEAEEEQEQEKQQPQEGKEEPKMEIAKLEQPVNKESEINGETITTTTATITTTTTTTIEKINAIEKKLNDVEI